MSDETKELAIGEEGVIDGVKVRCVEGGDSNKCVLNDRVFDCFSVKCLSHERSDGLDVHFEEVK